MCEHAFVCSHGLAKVSLGAMPQESAILFFDMVISHWDLRLCHARLAQLSQPLQHKNHKQTLPHQIFPRDAKDWVQDLRHAWQDFTHWVISLALENDSFLFKAISPHTFKQLILYTYLQTSGTITYNDLTIDWGISLSLEDAGPKSLWNCWTKGWKSQLHFWFRSPHLPAPAQARHSCLSLIRRNKTKTKETKTDCWVTSTGRVCDLPPSGVGIRPPRWATCANRPHHSLSQCLSNLACTTMSSRAC